MIITIKNAVLHILDGNSGITAYSDMPLDTSEVSILTFITTHIEKVYDDPSLRTGQFSSNSGFKYHLLQYLENQTDFVTFSKNITQKLYEGISSSDKIDSSDVIVCECTIHEQPVIAVLKCNNRIGFTHKVISDGDETKTEIINHYAILPEVTKKLTECAFINTADMSIRFKGKRVSIDGESADLFADIMLECEFEYSTKESYTKVEKIAKAVAADNGTDVLAAESRMKTFVQEIPAETTELEVAEVAKAAFPEAPAARNEFIEKVKEAEIPEKIEKHQYITKRASKNMKLVTDTGIEISFPAEYYRDNKNLSIITNDDGSLSINIGNITEIMNK